MYIILFSSFLYLAHVWESWIRKICDYWHNCLQNHVFQQAGSSATCCLQQFEQAYLPVSCIIWPTTFFALFKCLLKKISWEIFHASLHCFPICTLLALLACFNVTQMSVWSVGNEVICALHYRDLYDNRLVNLPANAFEGSRKIQFLWVHASVCISRAECFSFLPTSELNSHAVGEICTCR